MISKDRSIRLLFFLLSLSSFQMTTTAQKVVQLVNPSFEGNPHYNSVPGDWRNCAFGNETSPDLHPVRNDLKLVRQTPQDGDTFLGLMGHGNAATESIGQKLSSPLLKGQCYSLSIYLCRSEELVFQNLETNGPVDYTRPGVLRIWGGVSPCGQKTLLAVSPPVENTGWLKYTFQFKPDDNLTWLSFEIYYVNYTRTAYNCNLLMDGASPVIPIDCQTRAPLADPESLETPPYRYVKYEIPGDIRSQTFYSAYGGSYLLLELRVVRNPDEVESIILDNCNEIGFRFGRPELIDEFGIGLKEVAVNVDKFRKMVLVVGIPSVGKRLVKRRTKRLKRIFREIGLPKRQYRIEPLPLDHAGEGWLCGYREIWLKLERR